MGLCDSGLGSPARVLLPLCMELALLFRAGSLSGWIERRFQRAD